MVRIIESLIPTSQKNQRPGYSMTPQFITVHQTANASKGANAEMHSRYLLNGAGGRVVGWHFTVDDTPEIYQHLPTNEAGWHAGDGTSGLGNRRSIGIEICENSDGDFGKAVANAVWLIKKLMAEHNIPIENVVPHKRWTGKNCPRKLLNYRDDFINSIGIVKVEQVSKPKPVVESVVKPTIKPAVNTKPSTTTSIVDWMNANKMDSSFANRAKLAKHHGFRDYKGTADQNIALLSMLQNSKPASKPSTVAVKTDSIVDWLNANKMDSSFSNRAKMAKKLGIKNYRGTAAQNIALLSKLRK